MYHPSHDILMLQRGCVPNAAHIFQEHPNTRVLCISREVCPEDLCVVLQSMPPTVQSLLWPDEAPPDYIVDQLWRATERISRVHLFYVDDYQRLPPTLLELRCHVRTEAAWRSLLQRLPTLTRLKTLILYVSVPVGGPPFTCPPNLQELRVASLLNWTTVEMTPCDCLVALTVSSCEPLDCVERLLQPFPRLRQLRLFTIKKDMLLTSAFCELVARTETLSGLYITARQVLNVMALLAVVRLHPTLRALVVQGHPTPEADQPAYDVVRYNRSLRVLQVPTSGASDAMIMRALTWYNRSLVSIMTTPVVEVYAPACIQRNPVIRTIGTIQVESRLHTYVQRFRAFLLCLRCAYPDLYAQEWFKFILWKTILFE
jgi:hypothetical protein